MQGLVMKVKADQRTEACIAVEIACADIYRGLSERFPEEGLWQELSSDERNHAVLLQMARGGREGELIDFLDRETMPFINEALGCARTFKKRLEADDLTLEDALRMSLELEKSTVEGYFWDALTGETELQAISRFKQLIEKEQSHGKKILNSMTAKGIIAHTGFRPEIPVA